MSKFMKKFKVEIKGALQGNTINMTLPVELSLTGYAAREATNDANHLGVTDVEIISITEAQPTWEQLEIDFEQPSSVSTNSYSSYTASRTHQDCNAQEAQSLSSTNSESTSHSEPSESNYKSYTSVKALQEAEESLPPTFTPRINNSYTPYKTKTVSIDPKYKDFDFR